MEGLIGAEEVVWWNPQESGYDTIGQPTPHELGRGYWAQFPDNTQATIPGTAVIGQFVYGVHNGWNTISMPYLHEISLESIASGITIKPFAWTDQGNGYELVAPITDSLNLIHNTLKSWWGYWVLSDGDGTITWNQTSPTAQQLQPLRMGRASAEQGSWQIQLTAQAGERVDLFNYCGVADEQTAQALAIANPPGVSGSVDLYFPSQAGPMALPPVRPRRILLAGLAHLPHRPHHRCYCLSLALRHCEDWRSGINSVSSSSRCRSPASS